MIADIVVNVFWFLLGASFYRYYTATKAGRFLAKQARKAADHAKQTYGVVYKDLEDAKDNFHDEDKWTP